jgi:hypothetical protein
MWNFLPRTEPAFSLLYGKRPLQRVVVGSRGQQIEIPLNVVEDLPAKCDTSATYIGNKYVSLPWAEFTKIKQDAANLIGANVRSALTGLDWYPKVKALAEAQTATTEAGLLSARIKGIKSIKYPIATQN